jgi:DNA polymerase I-like protein with 3'-5' exonuclease and polymerase domains
MNVLTLDVETTISNKGNPFDLTNKCCMVGVKWLMDDNPWKSVCYDVSVSDYWLDTIQNIIDKTDLIVGFNIKFDLHWLRNIGIDISNIRIWDCQLAEYLISKQSIKYPSLNGCLERYGLPLKLDVVKTEYWDKGIDTDKIPTEILEDYLVGDLVATEQVYLRQKQELEELGLMKLFRLQCQDLLVLEEIEYNGIKFNTEGATKKADEITEELSHLVGDITKYTGCVPINLNSGEHISCLLYGGFISEDIRIPIGVFKTGEKVGQPRYKILTKEYKLPRLIEPLKGTENLKKDDTIETCRYWYTNETVLRSLRPNKEAKKLLTLLDKYAELEKLRSTYLLGWTKLITEMNWTKDTIHGNLNQCVAITGRLSSTKPNLQNADPTTKIYCETRY